MRPVVKDLHGTAGDGPSGSGVSFAVAPGAPCPRCGRTLGVLVTTNGHGGLHEEPQPCRGGPNCQPFEHPRPKERNRLTPGLKPRTDVAVKRCVDCGWERVTRSLKDEWRCNFCQRTHTHRERRRVLAGG